MGGGVIKDVSAKLVDQFAANLGGMLGERPAEAEPAVPGTGAAAPGAAAVEAPSPVASSGSEQKRAAPDEDSGVDALGVAASVTADRLRDPRVLAGSFAVVLLVGWLLGRRSAR